MRGASRSSVLIMLCFVVLLASCEARRGPDIPSNAAVWFVEAALDGDSAQVRSRSCDAVTSSSDVDLADPATFGGLADFLEMLVGDPDRRVGWSGSGHQYTATEELDLQADEAWTEMELGSGGEPIGVWRLHMVREDGRWKACAAELRQ